MGEDFLHFYFRRRKVRYYFLRGREGSRGSGDLKRTTYNPQPPLIVQIIFHDKLRRYIMLP